MYIELVCDRVGCGSKCFEDSPLRLLQNMVGGGGAGDFRVVIDDPEEYLDALEVVLESMGALPAGTNDGAAEALMYAVPAQTAATPSDRQDRITPSASEALVPGFEEYSSNYVASCMLRRFGSADQSLPSATSPDATPAHESGQDQSCASPPEIIMDTGSSSSPASASGAPLQPVEKDFSALPDNHVDVGGGVVIDLLDDEQVLAEMHRAFDQLPSPELDLEAELIPIEDDIEDDTDHESDAGTTTGSLEQQVHDHFGRMQQYKRRRVTTKTAPVIPQQPAQRLHHAAASRGLHPVIFRRMVLCGLPLVLLNCFTFLQCCKPINEQEVLDGCELFSGVASVVKGFQQEGLVAAEYDFCRNSVMENILSSEGLLTAINLLRCTRPRGLAHFATVCSSWVYLSRAATGRTSGCPEGNPGVRCVESANSMAARVSLLLVLCSIFELAFLHEQPLTSLLSASRYYVWSRTTIRRVLSGLWEDVFIWMGAYGHSLLKPTQLITNQRIFRRLYREISAQDRQVLFDASAGVQHLPHDEDSMKRRVTGKSKGLRCSQDYPAEYGTTVAALWKEFYVGSEHEDYLAGDVASDDEEVPWDKWREAAQQGGHWPEARLGELAELLHIPKDRALP